MARRKLTFRAAGSAVLCAACLCFSSSALGAARTTDPGQGREYVFVTMTDSRIVFTTESAYCCDAKGGRPGTPRAWSTLSFRVTNKGRKPHNFSLAGKATRAIAPGSTLNSSWYFFPHRGVFVYRSTLNPDPGLQGQWFVY